MSDGLANLKTVPVLVNRVLAFLLLAALAFTAAARVPPADLVKLRSLTATDAAHPGSELNVVVVADISEGYHINDHRPTLDYLIPTNLEWTRHRAIEAGKVIYPPGQMKSFPFSKNALSVYEGRLLIGARLRLDPGIKPGEYTLQGRLSYQACNDQACLPPAKEPFRLRIKVVSTAVRLNRLHRGFFDQVEFE